MSPHKHQLKRVITTNLTTNLTFVWVV